MYRWILFLHVAGVFGFLLAHGASASTAFALRRERNLERVRAMLTLSASSYPVMYSNGPAGVGSTFKWVSSFMGQKMDSGGQITVWNPPNQYEYKLTAGPIPGSGGTTFKADGNSTLVTQYGDFEPGGFFKLAAGLLMKQAEGQMQDDLRKL